MKIDHSKKLKEFTEQIRKMPEVIGISYTGSTATKKWDKYSDIDMDIFKNNQKEVVKIILKAIGEKPRKHPYEKLIRKFW
jgi:predicted nucleotidyltransferase